MERPMHLSSVQCFRSILPITRRKKGFIQYNFRLNSVYISEHFHLGAVFLQNHKQSNLQDRRDLIMAIDICISATSLFHYLDSYIQILVRDFLFSGTQLKRQPINCESLLGFSNQVEKFILYQQ